jgi:hypothetical protein
MSDSENKSSSSEECTSENHVEAQQVEKNVEAANEHVDRSSESSDESEKQLDTPPESPRADLPTDPTPPVESGNVDRSSSESGDKTDEPADKGETDEKPKQSEPEVTKPNAPSEKPAVSFSDPPPEKHASDPSPEPRALRGDDDSDASEQFFTVCHCSFSTPHLSNRTACGIGSCRAECFAFFGLSDAFSRVRLIPLYLSFHFQPCLLLCTLNSAAQSQNFPTSFFPPSHGSISRSRCIFLLFHSQQQLLRSSGMRYRAAQ